MTAIQPVHQRNATERTVQVKQTVKKPIKRIAKNDQPKEADKQEPPVYQDALDYFYAACARNNKMWEDLRIKLKGYIDKPRERIQSRFDPIEANINVLMFGFESIRKQSEESSKKSAKTSREFAAFKEQLTETVDGYVKRVNEAEERYFEVKETLEERERELMEVKWQLREQEHQMESLKCMIIEQREMLELCMKYAAKQHNDQPF